MAKWRVNLPGPFYWTESGVKFRKVLRIGPWALNFTQRGFSSLSTRLGPFTRNSRKER